MNVLTVFSLYLTVFRQACKSSSRVQPEYYHPGYQLLEIIQRSSEDTMEGKSLVNISLSAHEIEDRLEAVA
jgi:hypothetical protein